MANEETHWRRPAERAHVREDRAGMVCVQAVAREILQAQVAIAVDLRIVEPRLVVSRPTRIGPE